MARISENLLVNSARGNVGKQFVYKKRGNNTHIALMPKIDKNAVATERQEEVRDLFGSASLYAQGAMSSPDLKKQYQKKVEKGQTAHNVAFRDFTKPPRVKKIDAGKYDGKPGSSVTVVAKDDFRVVEVEISIHSSTGELVEKGDAFLNPKNYAEWLYNAVATNSVLTGSRITAIARDLPGNEAKLEITL